MKQVLGDFLDEVCDKYSQNECIYFPTTGATYTYEMFRQYVCDVEKGLVALGLNKGDLIAIKSSNTPEWLAMQWAGFKLGIIVVGLNAGLTPVEVAHAMKHTGARILFTDDMNYIIGKEKDYRVIIWEYANQFIIDLGKTIETATIEERNMTVTAMDPALILFTSGTTSEPKAVLMKHSAILSAIAAYNKTLSYKQADANQQDNALVCTPLAHMMGCLYGIMPVLAFGGKITLVEKFKTNTVLEIIEKERCTIFNGVPTMFLFLLDEYRDYDISSLRTGLIAGSYVATKLYKRITEELGMGELLQAFGQTETLAATGISMKDPWEKRMCTTGKALENVEIKIISPENKDGKEIILGPNERGEILIRSSYCMMEYLKNETATKKTINKEGWVHTGDLGYLDEEGYLYIKSRLKDIIIKGGENICPAEIEDALVQMEEIKEAVVVGVPDVYKTEEICAFVVPEDEEPLHIEQIKRALRKGLAKYKIPKYIIRIGRFPKTNSGKVKKEELKSLYSILAQ